MYNVSATYLEKINSVSRQVYWYGTITLTNGTVYSFDVSNLKQGQNSINKQLCADRKIQIGCTCSAELKLSFMLDHDTFHNTYSLNGIPVNKYDFYDALIVIYFRLYLDNNTYEEVNCGTYIVSEPERSQSVLICTAYDYMQKFAKECVSKIQGQPYNVLLTACNVCGVELGSTPSDLRRMINGQRICVEYDPKNQIKTWRDVIGYVASMVGGNATIKSDNKLYIIPYSEGYIRTVPSNDRFSLTLADYITNYNIISSINLRTNVEEKAKYSDEGLTYVLGGNPLIQYVTAEDRKQVISNLLYVLNRMKYVPFKGSFYADPSFELGDVIRFTDNHAGLGTLSVITEITLNLGSHMELSCDGENPYRQKAEEAANASYAEETTGTIDGGVTFYDRIYSNEINAAENIETIVNEIGYASKGYFRLEFIGEIKVHVTTKTSESGTNYTLNDGLITVKYYINSQEQSYHPQYTFTDGVYLLHLFYFWYSDEHIDISMFKVTITCTNASVQILRNESYGRIMQSGEIYEDVSNELAYIDIDHYPYKMTYLLNERIDYTGLKVVAVYEDERKKDITSQCTITPANNTQVVLPKDIMVDVNYTEDNVPYKASFVMAVKSLEAIEVKKDPTKMDYYVGENIDLSGVEIEALYTDDTSEVVTNYCTFSPADGTEVTEVGNIPVTVSYSEDSITKQCQIVLTALPVELDYIRIDRYPNKLSYEKGELLDYTGIQVTAVYTDGSEMDVSNQLIFDPVSGTPASMNMTSVTVSYMQEEDSSSRSEQFDIEVYEFTGIVVDQEPTKTSYHVGEAIDYSGIVIMGEYSNDVRENVTTACTFTPVNGTIITSTGMTGVVVEYDRPGDRDYFTNFSIDIDEAEPILKYLIYSIDNINRIIYVTGLEVDEIAADGISNLVIPTSYTDTESGITYEIVIS